MDWLAYALGDLFVWTFENLLVPFGDLGNSENLWFISPNFLFVILGFLGLGLWLSIQSKYNKAAANDPNQLK